MDESGKGTDGREGGGEKERRMTTKRREGMKNDGEEERRLRMREDFEISRCSGALIVEDRRNI